jgi:ABC-2 type transport system ATP-binding protein
VAGHDVVREANAVRASIGLTGQYAAVDEKLTGRENLQMVGRLLGMNRAGAVRRAGDLLDRFSLSDAGDREVSTYSGGMRRRVDLAVSLVGHPKVLFLDEPTTGLDPVSRLELWDITRELVAEGTTVLLTTQYLDEADELADRIVVIDHGRAVAEGTPDQLKDRLGGRTLIVELHDRDRLESARALLEEEIAGSAAEIEPSTRSLHLAVGEDTSLAATAIATLTAAGHTIDDFHLERPSLDDVFLSLTGAAAPGTPEPPDTPDTAAAAVEKGVLP